MQLIVNLDSNNFEMPYDHSYQLYSSLLALVARQNEFTATRLHQYDSGLKFSMSQLMPGGRRGFTKVGFHGERFVFILSSLDNVLINIFKDSLNSAGDIEIFKNKFKIHSILSREITPSSEIITVKSRSPVILKDNGKYLLNESDEQILSVLESNINGKYFKVKRSKPNLRFIKILSIKRKVVGIKGIKLPGLMITFTICADIEVLKFILSVGIGSKNQLGFGFVEEEKVGCKDGN